MKMSTIRLFVGDRAQSGGSAAPSQAQGCAVYAFQINTSNKLQPRTQQPLFI